MAFLVNDAVFGGFFFEDVSVADGFDVPEAFGYGRQDLISVVLDVVFFCWCGEDGDEVVGVYALCFFFGARETVEVDGAAGPSE